MQTISRSRLKNGLTLYVAPMPSAQSATVLVLVRAGSKYETKQTNGLSHFLEHMFFKGTTKRPTPKDVAGVLDAVGGEYNAFTDKEHTGYYARLDARHIPLAVDWVADMLLHATHSADEIEREKGVIHQELAMYYDTPTSYIGDVLESLLYGDQPAGWDIGGTRQTVANVTRKELLRYLTSRYVANETVVVVAGKITPAKVERLIEKHFASLPKRRTIPKPAVREKQTAPAYKLHEKQTDQTHLALAVRTYDAYDERRYAVAILAMILGGNMSSRLFTSLREKHSLAYYVSTRSQYYSDTGYLVTTAGVPNGKLAEATHIILSEYETMKAIGIDAAELNQAKDCFKGHAVIGLESSSAMASFIGDQAILKNKAEPVEVMLKHIDRVTTEQVLAVAKDIFQNKKLNLAVIGPRGEETAVRAALRFAI